MIRDTLSAVFVVGVCITMTTRAATGEITTSDVQIAALLLPAQLVGFLGSSRLRGRVEGPRLRRTILAVSAVSALALLVSALR